MVAQVPGESVFQAFLLQHYQGFMQGVEVVYRRGMVVGPFGVATPVTHYQLHVEEPALHLVFAVLDAFYRFLAEGDRGNARYAGQAFLGAGVHRVRTPGIYLEFDAAQ